MRENPNLITSYYTLTLIWAGENPFSTMAFSVEAAWLWQIANSRKQQLRAKKDEDLEEEIIFAPKTEIRNSSKRLEFAEKPKLSRRQTP